MNTGWIQDLMTSFVNEEFRDDMVIFWANDDVTMSVILLVQSS